MRVSLKDPEMTDYWAAVIMANAFTDKALAAREINCNSMTGQQLLRAFECMLADASRQNPKRQVKPAREVERIKGAASEAEIIAAMSPKGGWKASTLAQWGVAWPPPKGWRRKLVENFEHK